MTSGHDAPDGARPPAFVQRLLSQALGDEQAALRPRTASLVEEPAPRSPAEPSLPVEDAAARQAQRGLLHHEGNVDAAGMHEREFARGPRTAAHGAGDDGARDREPGAHRHGDDASSGSDDAPRSTLRVLRADVPPSHTASVLATRHEPGDAQPRAAHVFRDDDDAAPEIASSLHVQRSAAPAAPATIRSRPAEPSPALPTQHAREQAAGPLRPAHVMLPTTTAPPTGDREGDRRAVSQAAETVVRISIGRIDVRAVTEPAPATPAPPKPRSGPRLGLDDYVRERSRGER